MQKKKLIQAKIHDAPKAMATSERQQLSGKVGKDSIGETSRIEARQEEIDKYNFDTCQVIDPYFKSIQLAGNTIIVRLHKENFIKGVEMIMANGQPIYDSWISQVDGRMKQHQPEKWVDNPLPYVHTGVIVSISDSAKAHFLKEKKALEDIDLSLGTSHRLPMIGDIVNLEYFMFADARFYKNKQDRDFIKNPEEYSINNWEGYVSVHPTRVESIVLNKEAFKHSSAYRAFKDGALQVKASL